MDEQSFGNFISFLKEKRSDLEQADQLLKHFRHVAATHGEHTALHGFLEYIRIYTSLADDADKYDDIRSISHLALLGGVTGAAVGGGIKN